MPERVKIRIHDAEPVEDAPVVNGEVRRVNIGEDGIGTCAHWQRFQDDHRSLGEWQNPKTPVFCLAEVHAPVLNLHVHPAERD